MNINMDNITTELGKIKKASVECIAILANMRKEMLKKGPISREMADSIIMLDAVFDTINKKL